MADLLTQKLLRLKKQQSSLENRIQSIEAKKKSKERRADHKRKILVGSFYLQKAKDDNTLDELYKSMDPFLMKPSHRILFNLNPLSKNKKNIE